MEAKKLTKKVVSRAAGLGIGSTSSSVAVQVAGAGAKRVGAAIITHGLKVLGLGTMGAGIVTTAGIGIITCLGIVALLDELLD